ncbi:hypothetical protein RSAG8_05189, partial [Rhizoctonia solani AG-8 WAC10335]
MPGSHSTHFCYAAVISLKLDSISSPEM